MAFVQSLQHAMYCYFQLIAQPSLEQKILSKPPAGSVFRTNATFYLSPERFSYRFAIDYIIGSVTTEKRKRLICA